MGEYAKFKGHQIKIGTCEDLYYLRADQGHLVDAQRGNVNPRAADDRRVIRFRFPWPDEDHVEPGAFEAYDRAVGVYGVQPPADLEHYAVQFTAQAGYVVSLPCPEGPGAAHGLTVHRNGFAGPVKIVQQAYRNEHLALICACGGCGARYNLPTLAAAEPVIGACRAMAEDRPRDERRAAWWQAVADRIADGYRERG
jgi:hypothetical protein